MGNIFSSNISEVSSAIIDKQSNSVYIFEVTEFGVRDKYDYSPDQLRKMKNSLSSNMLLDKNNSLLYYKALKKVANVQDNRILEY